MRRRAATITALAAMAVAPVPRALAFAPELSIGRMCSDHLSPFSGRKRNAPSDCPDACHAACARSSRGERDEECGD